MIELYNLNNCEFSDRIMHYVSSCAMYSRLFGGVMGSSITLLDDINSQFGTNISHSAIMCYYNISKTTPNCNNDFPLLIVLEYISNKMNQY